jgi:methionyl-tRNA formyltransferase
MRLVMLATGPFAVPTFRALYETHHEVAALITSPLRPSRSAEPLPIPLIRDVAHEHSTPIHDPDDINTPEALAQLGMFEPDLLVVCDYGQILAAETLATARLGGVNLHGSLLPKYRGAAPINWAIYNGDTMTGVTVIHMTPKVDAGPCIAQAVLAIEPDETAPELETRLSEAGAWLMRRTIDNLESGALAALPQNPALASKAPRLKKSDGAVDWARSAQAIRNQIRAFEPWPKCYTYWRRASGAPVRLIVGPANAIDCKPTESPGTVIEAKDDQLLIATGEGALALTAVQPSGKRAMPTQEFLRGYRVRPGDCFGPEGGK